MGVRDVCVCVTGCALIRQCGGMWGCKCGGAWWGCVDEDVQVSERMGNVAWRCECVGDGLCGCVKQCC